MERRKTDIFSTFVFNDLQNSSLFFNPPFFFMILASKNKLTILISTI